MIKNRKEYMTQNGFTLIEMVIVLFIISVIMLLVIPNLTDQKKNVDGKGSEALATVIQTQIELYDMEESVAISKSDITLAATALKGKGYLTESQSREAVNKLIIENGRVKVKGVK